MTFLRQYVHHMRLTQGHEYINVFDISVRLSLTEYSKVIPPQMTEKFGISKNAVPLLTDANVKTSPRIE